jgi:hypothetical protein
MLRSKMNLTLMLKLVDVVAWHITKCNSCFVYEKLKDNFYKKKPTQWVLENNNLKRD